jgi:predicted enzyme related to lactoylglutathione lyase
MQMKSTPVRSSSVIYAKDIRKVAAFYQRTLGLSALEDDADFVLVGDEGLQIAVVKMPDDIAKDVQIATPPIAREETPIKCSFLVEDLDRVHAEAHASGGGTRPIAAAWRWRGQLHLDGYDPEGNVVQFRQRDAQSIDPA